MYIWKTIIIFFTNTTMNDSNSVVIDNGSYMIRAGFANDEKSFRAFPTTIGRPKYHSSYGYNKKYYIGEEAEEKRIVLKINNPIENGVITDWDDMGKVWDYTFNNLGIASEEHPILMTEPPNNPKRNRERMIQIMFETYNTPLFYTHMPAVLALAASGRMTGCVVDCGYSTSHVVPVYEGFSLPGNIMRLDMGGKSMDEYLRTKLCDQNNDMETYNTSHFRRTKEEYCYVSMDIEKEKDIQEKSYEMPDGNTVYIKKERVRVPEILFDLSIGDNNLHGGIHQATCRTISKCDEDLHRELFSNIAIAGGSTKFPGFCERMQKEVEPFSPSSMKAVVYTSPDPDRMAWCGGSMFSSLSSYRSMWISLEEYDEYGPNVVYKICH